MRNIKYVLIVTILFFVISSCHKKGVAPSTASKVDTDAILHSVKLMSPPQYVSTSVVGDTLEMIYYENVRLSISDAGFTYSYAIHLIEDFSNTSLYKVNYITYDQAGNINYDYVDDNLNDVSAKSIKDTTIAGVASKIITVQRPFIFKKHYATNQAAVMGQDSIDAVTTQNMNFHSYVYFEKTYPATSQGTNLYYVKQQ
ncbi:hypothetical protein [Mucilaginibacter sp.]